MIETLVWFDEHDQAHTCQIYSPGWAEALGELYIREDPAEVRRALRKVRRDLARESGVPMRLRVSVANDTDDFSRYRDADSMEVYGWRAALVALRAMREELVCYPDGERLPSIVTVSDARLDAVREALNFDGYCPAI